MMKLLEKYYNILYYCEYNLLFLILKRLLNPFYWLSIPKWNNKYMKCILSKIEKQEVSEIHGGVNVFISSWAIFAISCTSFWLLCMVLIVGSKVLKMLGIGVPIAIFEYEFILLLLLISLIFYLCYINELFVFKKDKYRKYFAEFDKKKRYLLYYGIYVVSLVVRWATFYGGRLFICCLAGCEGGAETNGGDSMPCGISGGKRNSRTGATGYLYGFIEQ